MKIDSNYNLFFACDLSQSLNCMNFKTKELTSIFRPNISKIILTDDHQIVLCDSINFGYSLISDGLNFLHFYSN